MILIIDDDAVVRSSLSLLLRRSGYEVVTVKSPDETIDYLRENTPKLMIMDMNFSLTTKGDEGLELLQKVKIFAPDVPVILITAWGSISLAVKGMQAGAFDFITKPWDNRLLLNSIATALELHNQTTKNDLPITRKELDAKYHFSSIIGQSEPLINILSTVARIATTNASVLITGESGTGKELIAEAIHNNSKQRENSFVKVNLGGISQSLFESEMFGHKKGAFTDAYSDRKGRFEIADKGTIFLDEIGELDLSSQVKLLRVLQDQTFEVLGESRPKKVSVRVVSATNADLQEMVKEKRFREDLFYRINLIHIHLPPLRERKEDIPLLVRHFADKLSKQNNLRRINFTPSALEYLQTLPLLGNIRELKNLIERSVLISGKETLEKEDIQSQYDGTALTNRKEISFNMTLGEIESERIRQCVEENGGNISKAAKALGISRAALYRKLEKHKL